MARSADELQSQSPSPSSSQLQNKQLWSKGASFTRNDLHEAARRSFAKSRARNEARGTRRWSWRWRRGSHSFQVATQTRANRFVVGAQLQQSREHRGRGVSRTGDCLRAASPPPISHTDTHTLIRCPSELRVWWADLFWGPSPSPSPGLVLALSLALTRTRAGSSCDCDCDCD